MGKYMRIPFIILLSSMLLPWWEQSPARPEVFCYGDTVRVSTAKFIGSNPTETLSDFRNNSLIVQTKNHILFIPIRKITKLEIAMGKRSCTQQGAVTGAIAGGIGLGLLRWQTLPASRMDGKFSLR